MDARIGILATMPNRPKKTMGAATVEIYSKRQVRRPHYLAKLMARKPVTRAQLIEELGVDKSQVSRWLDENIPSTPSPEWAKKLWWYFAISDDADDFVDIFTDPDLARFQKMTRNMPDDEVDRMLTTLEAAYTSRRAS